jgi:epsilon-lactone hydrolase
MTDDAVPTRGSLRSRAAAVVSALTLRQISAVLPPEQALGLWLSPEAAKAMAHVARFSDTSLRANSFDATVGRAG